jgi:hypothetical protein
MQRIQEGIRHPLVRSAQRIEPAQNLPKPQKDKRLTGRAKLRKRMNELSRDELIAAIVRLDR